MSFLTRIINKKTFLLPFLLIVVSLFCSHKLFTPAFYTSHDGEGHVIRMIEFDEALKEGQFPVRIAKRINYGLGYPFFNFNYPFIYYLGEAIHLLGFSFVSSFKAIMVLSILIGGLSIFYFTIKKFGNLAAFITALAFTLAPYKFLNLYVRGNVAESFGLALVPVLFLTIDLVLRRKRFSSLFLTLSLSLLILSHNISALIAIPFAFAYLIVRLKWSRHRITKEILITYFLSLSWSLFITAFFWLPVLIEARLTKLSEAINQYQFFFPSLKEILYSPWGFGPFKQGTFPGEMSPQIGLAHLLIFVLVIILLTRKILFKKKSSLQDREGLFFVLSAIVFLFVSLAISKFLWDNCPPLQLVQLPWRFVGFIIFCSSMSAGYLINQIKKLPIKLTVTLFLTILFFYSNRNHIKVNMYTEFKNPFETNPTYSLSTTSHDEHMPKDAPRIHSVPNPNGNLIPETAGTSKRITWKSNYHLFEIDLKEAAVFRDNTSIFPGWQARIDGQTTPLIQDPYYRLSVNIPAGKHQAEFLFRETTYRQIANFATLGGILLLILSAFSTIFTPKSKK